MRHLSAVTAALVAVMTVAGACCNTSLPAPKAGTTDRSQESITEFDYTAHCSVMCRGTQMAYAFEKFFPETAAKGPKTAKRVTAWQEALRGELKKATGVSILESQLRDYVPSARKIDSEDLGWASRERWQIQTEPDVNLPFVLIVPHDIKGKAPLVVTPHGHGKNTEQYAGIYTDPADSISAVDGQRNMALLFAREGMITITPAARGFEGTNREQDKDRTSSCADLMLKDALVGRTPVGDRVWDIMRIIDWALGNLPVDERNIIVTGNSGGGTQSIYAGAIDTRISICMPASSFSDYESSIGVQEHCACNYIPGIMNLGDMGDIAGLVAPRALCLIQGQYDPIFPIEGAKEQFSRVSRIYSAAGAGDMCELYIGPEGHRYYFDGADTFVKKHLAE